MEGISGLSRCIGWLMIEVWVIFIGVMLYLVVVWVRIGRML